MSNSTKISRGAAIEILKNKVFGLDFSDDTVLFEDLITKNARNQLSKETNRSWTNSLTQKLKYHDFVTPVKESRNGNSKIVGLKITNKGKMALNEAVPSVSTVEKPETIKPKVTDNIPNEVTMDQLLILIEQWRLKHPGFKRLEHSNFEVVFKTKESDM